MFTHIQTEWLGQGCLTLLLALAVGWIAADVRRRRFGLLEYGLHLVGRILTRIGWRATIIGTIQLPATQGAIIIGNHRGPIDPALIAQATPRRVHWLVAREFVDSRAYGWGLRALQVIPTNRGGVDTAATRLAVRLAASGSLVGMFPEGRINTTSAPLLPGRPGAALIALKARVPVIPCYLDGVPTDTRPFGFLFERCRARLVIGAPLDLSAYYDRASEREVQEDLTKQFLRAIAELGGHQDFEPQLAGRRWKPSES